MPRVAKKPIKSTMPKDVRVFLDSNVILSGLMSSKGSPRVLLDLLSLEAPHFKGLTGQYNIEEIERNLKDRFPELLPVWGNYFSKLKLEIVAIPPWDKVSPFTKKMSLKDAPVLVSAQLGNSDYLITGDKRGFPKEAAKPVLIVSPTDFLNKILPDLVIKWSEEV